MFSRENQETSDESYSDYDDINELFNFRKGENAKKRNKNVKSHANGARHKDYLEKFSFKTESTVSKILQEQFPPSDQKIPEKSTNTQSPTIDFSNDNPYDSRMKKIQPPPISKKKGEKSEKSVKNHLPSRVTPNIQKKNEQANPITNTTKCLPQCKNEEAKTKRKHHKKRHRKFIIVMCPYAYVPAPAFIISPWSFFE